MKAVLFFDHDAKITGSSISMRYIIESFLKNGFQVYLLTRKESMDLNSFQDQGVKIITYSRSPWKSIALSIHFSDEFSFLSKKWFLTFLKNKIRLVVGIFTCFQVIKKIRPDLVYINEHNMFYCGFIAKLFGIPSFIHIRSKFIHGLFGITERILSRLILASNNHIFAITMVESEQILKSNRKFSNKVRVIPEFLNENDFLIEDNQTGIRKRMNLPLDKLIVISFGGVDELKGTDDFLQCIKMVCKRNSNVYFILAGNLEETEKKKKSSYQKRIDELLEDVEIQNNLKCIGFVHNAKQIIIASDILVSSLKYSHFSRPIIEGWAVKKAIITSDTNHARSYIREFVDGLYYNSGNIEGLSNAILKLVEDRELYNKIAENGYNKSRNYFFNESNPDQIVKLFMT
jgi:glycosyltransferase involved in cell wall biosynthesis